MRVNMDSSIAFDPRFKMIAKSLGISLREVIGSCFLLWLHCYQSRSERLSVAQANASADVDGFAEAMIVAGLADEENVNGAVWLKVHGVKERIRFLTNQRSRGKAGGKASAKSKAAKAVTANDSGQANAKQTLEQTLTQVSTTAQAYSPTPSPPLTPSPDPTPADLNTRHPASPVAPRKRKTTVKIPRERNPLFDAIAEVTGVDPATAGSSIGIVWAALSKADPPYTPEEVKTFGNRYLEFCSWAAIGQRPTPSELQKFIGRVRAGVAPAPPEPEPPKSKYHHMAAHSTPSGMCPWEQCPQCKSRRGNPDDPNVRWPDGKKTTPITWNPDTHENDEEAWRKYG